MEPEPAENKSFEQDVQRKLDSFWLQATELWFKWLAWSMLVGVISYIEEKTGNQVIGILKVLSYMALLMYWQAFFFSRRFDLFPLLKRELSRRIIYLVISGLLAFAVSMIISQLIPLAKT
jgi:hypothetical protein